MKRYRITLQIEDLTAYVYIEAKSVVQKSHERVLADGVTIDLPGNIVAIRIPRR